MKPVKLKDVKKGDFIRKTMTAKKTFTKGAYDRSYKKFECNDWDDISNSCLISGDKIVYIDFDF